MKGVPWETSGRVPKPAKLIASREPGDVPIVSNDYERRPCGCLMAAGVRIDNQEQAVYAFPCPEHRRLMEAVIERFRQSLAQPLATPSMTVLLAMYDEALGAKPN